MSGWVTDGGTDCGTAGATCARPSINNCCNGGICPGCTAGGLTKGAVTIQVSARLGEGGLPDVCRCTAEPIVGDPV
jgi:hypothetical protein